MGSITDALKQTLRTEALDNPTIETVADWLLVEDNEDPDVVAALRPSLVTRARLLNRRRKLQDQGAAARKKIEERASASPVRKRLSRIWPSALKLVMGLPWSTAGIFVGLWLLTHTCRRPAVVVDGAPAWYPDIRFDKADIKLIKNTIGELWISTFAIETLRDLPSLCTAELVNGDPSESCVDDLSARLRKIISAEAQELDTIDPEDKNREKDGLRYEIKHWDSQALDGPRHARMLFERDFISDVLWGPAWLMKMNSTMDELDYRKRLALTRLDQYEFLVSSLRSKAERLEGVLQRHRELRTANTHFLGHSTASIVLRNVGESDADIDLSGVKLRPVGLFCLSTVAVLDPYTHRKTSNAAIQRLSLKPGTAARIELEITCGGPVGVVNPKTTLEYSGPAPDEFQFDPAR